MNFTAVRLQKILLLHRLLWNCFISLKGLQANQSLCDAVAKTLGGYRCVFPLFSGKEKKNHHQQGIRCLKLNLHHQPQPRGADDVRPVFTIVRVQVRKQYDSRPRLTSIYITYTVGVGYCRLHHMIHLSELWPPRCLSQSFSYHLLFFCAPHEGHSTPHRNRMKGSASAVASGSVF